MKQGRKLSHRQAKVLIDAGYDFMDWLLERQDHNSYTYVNRTTKEIITLRFK